MSFDWTEYLNLAEELAGQAQKPSTEEARLRSAISRAYYAAFSTARYKLPSIPSNLAGSVHTYVWKNYKNNNDLTRSQIGANGDRLRKDRNRADYDTTVSNLPKLTEKALKVSSLTISLLKTLP